MNALYMPVVGAREHHGPWNDRNSMRRAHTLKPRNKWDKVEQGNRRQSRSSPVHEGTYPNESFSTYNGVDLSSMINYDKGGLSMLLKRSSPMDVDEYEAARERHMNSIRTFGYEYLRPPGVNKTMQALLEENEEYSDAGTEDEEMQEDIGSEFEVVDDEDDMMNNFNTPLENTHRTREGVNADGPRLANPPQEEEEDEVEEGDEQAEEEEDLDAAIPEAEDNDYEDDYDEEEYQEGFMAEEEEYDEQQQPQQQESDDFAARADDSPTANEEVTNRSATIQKVVAANNSRISNGLMEAAVETQEDDEQESELYFEYSSKKSNQQDEPPAQQNDEPDNCDDEDEDDEADMSFE